MKRQSVLYGGAAAVTLWSAWIVVQGPSGSAPPSAAPRPRADAVSTLARPVAEPAVATGSAAARPPAAPRTRIAEAPRDDAFAERQWVAPQPPPPPPPPPTPPAPPAPPAPPPLPTLPYRFVGLFDEGGASKPRVFLSLGDKLLVAGVGDSLEGGFRLVSISANELVFSHLQQNVTLRLAVTPGSS